VVAPLLCKATMLDKREVRRRVVGLLAATFVGQRVPEALYVSLIATALVGQRLPNATALLNECEGRGLRGTSVISRLFLPRGCRLTALFANRRLSLPVSLFSLIGECLGLSGGHLHTLLLRLQRTSKAFVLVVLAGKSGLALLLP
jgi:hypothetical protein